MIKRTLILISVVVFAFQAAQAQQTGSGLPAFGTFANSDFDTINAGNLNLHFTIPIFSKPGRGLPVTYSETYDNNSLWTVTSLGPWGWEWIPGWYNAWLAPFGNPRRLRVIYPLSGTSTSLQQRQSVRRATELRLSRYERHRTFICPSPGCPIRLQRQLSGLRYS